MRVTFAIAAIALALGACAAKEKQWVKEGASPNTLRSDLYWCTRYHRQKYDETNARILGQRPVEKRVNADCMRKKGYRYE